MPSHFCSSATNHRLVGDPVDTLTGAVFDRKLEFRLTGPLELWWYRHYDSSCNQRRVALGWGHSHDFDRVLRFDGEGITYEAPVGRLFAFPRLKRDGDEIAGQGYRLRRLFERRYKLVQHGEPSMEFEFHQLQQPARLRRLFQGQHQILFHYDAAHRLARIVDSTGRNIIVVEEADGRLTSLTLEGTQGQPDVLLVAYHYDERGNLIATKDASGHGYAFTYDKANRMLMRRGRKGFKFRFDYDALGRCIKSTGDDGLYEVTLTYTVPRRVTKVRRADNGEWTYFFDAAGILAKIRDPLGGIQKFLRDETGQVVMELDCNNNATRIVYDPSGAPVAKITPLGHRIALPEDSNAPDPLGHRVAANPAEYEYGRWLDLKAITLPDACVTQGLPLPFEAKRCVSTRPQGVNPKANGDGFRVRPLGALWWPAPEQGRIFNDFGKLVEQQDEFGRRRRWTYDASGNVADYTDFDGGKWSYENGSWHLLREVVDPMGAKVRFSHTTNGQVSSCTDAGGTHSEYGYDLKDHLVEVKRHGVVREKYSRDAVGTLTAKHAGDGRPLLQFEIGPGNLPTKRILASGDEHSFDYDKSGRCLIAATKKDSVEFAYNALGNCCAEKRNGQGVEHRFQGWRVPAESVFFGRFSVRYKRQPDSALVIIDPGGKKHYVRCLEHGLVERQFSNGSHEFSQYDGQGRCLFKCAQRVAGQVWSRVYQWSGEGELHRVLDNLHGEVRHEYDAAHRLRRRILPGNRIEDYELDLAGNLVRQPSLNDVHLLQGNRLHAVGGMHVEYDDRNHLTMRETPDGPVRYGYDSRDQLVRVESPQGLWEAEYDALGRRTRKICDGKTTEYYWNSDQLIAERHPDGRLRLYVYADPLALTPLLFLEYDSSNATQESSRRYFIFSDQIGSPCLVEDESGADVWRAAIEPFGNAKVASEAKIEVNLRFPGHYFDTELGLHYNRFRCYDPSLGRYLQSDPLGIAGGYNLYAYCSNPLLQVDVRGLGEEEDNEPKPKPKPTPDKKDDEGTGKGGGPLPEEPPPGGKFPGRTPESDAAAEAAVKAMNDPKNGLTNGEKSRMVIGLSTEEGSQIVGISGKDDVPGVIAKIGPDMESQGIVLAPAKVDTSGLTEPGVRRDGSTFPGSDNSCGEAKAHTQAGQMGETPNGQTAMWGNPDGKKPTGVTPTPAGSNVYPPCNSCQSNESNIVNLSKPGEGSD
jgi:RHS repeat-associated protein